MKLKNLFRAFLLLAIVAAGISTAEAKKRTKGRSHRASGVAVSVIAEKSYPGNLVFKTFQAKKSGSEVTVEFPVSGDEAVLTAIRKWICRELSYPYSATISPETMIKKTLAVVGPNKEIMERQCKISVNYSSDKAITMKSDLYDYMGGAHGMPTTFQTTFLLSNGSELTSEMLPPINKLRPYIIQAMMKEYDMSRSELQNMLFGSPDELPLGSPAVVAGGLHIQYQAYDIAPYSAGMPECTIPLSDIESLLSPQVLKFF